jgi:uncharacterized membrane protein
MSAPAIVAVPDASVAPVDSAGETLRTQRWQWAVLAAIAAVAWLTFTAALLAQHRTYRSNAFDLGFFDQIIWNTAQGRWFETSFVDYNFLGQHMEPVLLPFAAAYRLGANVEILLAVQAAVVTAAALPLFLAARRLLVSSTAALLVAAAYLLSPHLHGAVLFDFHPEVLGIAAVFAAFALLVHGRPGWSLAAVVSLALLKEDAALAATGFALIVWVSGRRRHALALLAVALLYAAVVAGLVMPAIRGGPGDLQDRYGYLGTDSTGVARGAIRHPGRVAEHLLAPPRLAAGAYPLATLALLPLASLAVLAAAPLLAANLLSTHPAQNELTLHYAALPYAVLVVAAVLGAARSAKAIDTVIRPGRVVWRNSAVVIATLLLAASAVSWFLGSPLGPRRFDGSRYLRSEHHAATDRVLALIPPDAPLSAQSGLLPHLSRRQWIWEFPRLEGAEYVVVDRNGWRSSQADAAGYDAVLAALPSQGFCRLVAEESVELYARGEPCGSR